MTVRRRTRFARLLLGSALIACPLAAAAQAPDAPDAAGQAGILSYPAAFFDAYQPANALDMVERLPGFSYSKGEDVRGFAGAVGNVLVDGERPSSKAVTLDDMLRRIPAGSVERIDLVRGGAGGINMHGLPVVANVIRRSVSVRSGAVDAGTEFYHDRAPGALLRLEGLSRTDSWSFEASANLDIGRYEQDAGEGRVLRRDVNGITTGLFRADIDARIYQLNGGLQHRGRGVLNLNLGWDLNQQRRGERYALTRANGFRFAEQVVNAQNVEKLEAGGDYQWEFAGGARARVVSLLTRRRTDLDSSSSGLGAPQVSVSRSTARESILRPTLTLPPWRGVGIEAGGEAALNSLDSRSGLSVGGAAVAVPSANVTVKETRGEGFVTLTARPAPRLNLEAGLRVETSTISQSGDVNRSKTFTFAKPRLIATFAPSPDRQARLRIERTVGQLNFQDFAATGDLTLGAVSAGNVELEPERAWLAELALEQRFWGKGAAVLTWTRYELESVLDRVPIVTPARIFDAPGNIARGRRDDLKLDLAVPLDPLGAAGTLVRFIGTWRKSEVVDPVTGAKRPISGLSAFSGELHLTQDAPAWNSTFGVSGRPFGFTRATYRVNEYMLIDETIFWRAYWDWKPRPDLLVHLQVESFNTKDKSRTRVVHAGTRAGPLAFSEQRHNLLRPFFQVRVRKSF